MTQFSEGLITWYKKNKRDLPWRHTKDPYRIWLSEIILQQTQVAQGLAYYNKFAEHYPTVKHLAKAPVDEVMRMWAGLGYYSRARNLHETAKYITSFHKGIFPKTYEDIRALKGVGNYTAAAIASLAYDLPHAVVDGNVYRVLSRVFNIKTPIDSTTGKKQFQELANELLPPKRAAVFNQAIMEFGARHCRPVNPDCNNCTLNALCLAYSKKRVTELPVKANKTKISNRYLNYVVFKNDTSVYIRKRNEKDIWQGLYEFYLVETAKAPKPADLLKSKEFVNTNPEKKNVVRSVSSQYKHVLSHRHLYATFYLIETKKAPLGSGFKKIKLGNIGNYAFPRLIEKYVDEYLKV